MRERAIELLEHYFAISMGKRSARELPSDYRYEIAEAVDCIIAAARATGYVRHLDRDPTNNDITNLGNKLLDSHGYVRIRTRRISSFLSGSLSLLSSRCWGRM